MSEQKNNDLHFAYICDENYVYITVISITSLIASKKTSEHYVIHILAHNISNRSVDIFKACEENGIYIDLVDVSEYKIPYSPTTEKVHVPITALFKFFLPEILPYTQRLLYIDGDTLVQKNISNLFDLNLDSYYAAVCMDWTILLTDRYKGHQSRYAITNDNYFNSGFMLLNTEKMRADSMPNKLLDFKLNHNTYFMDQDAFNAVLGHRVFYLDCSYNFLTKYPTRLSAEDLTRLFPEYNKNREGEFYSNCFILHMVGQPKPWEYSFPWLSDNCKKHFMRSPLPKFSFTFRTKNALWFELKQKLKGNLKEKIKGKIKKIFSF